MAKSNFFSRLRACASVSLRFHCFSVDSTFASKRYEAAFVARDRSPPLLIRRDHLLHRRFDQGGGHLHLDGARLQPGERGGSASSVFFTLSRAGLGGSASLSAESPPSPSSSSATSSTTVEGMEVLTSGTKENDPAMVCTTLGQSSASRQQKLALKRGDGYSRVWGDRNWVPEGR